MDDAYVLLDATPTLFFDLPNVRMGGLNGTQHVSGFLFRDVRLPQGAAIITATLTLYRWYQTGEPVVVEAAGQMGPQANDFSRANVWPDQRPLTVHRVTWTNPDNKQDYWRPVRSPDLAAIVQEVVGQADWRAGNNLALLINQASSGEQMIDWRAYDLDPAKAAQISISYKILPITATPTPTTTSTPTATATATPTATLTASPTPTATATGTPTRVPGLVVRGRVSLNGALGPGVPGVMVQVFLASYPSPATAAVTDAEGRYETSLIYMPGDEMITVRPVLAGYTFDPPQYFWWHYTGAEEAVRDFAAFGGPPANTATPTPIATATSTMTSTPTVTATPTSTITATPTPTATATQTPTPTSTSTVTVTPTATATRSPTASRTPTPTATVPPTATPRPSGGSTCHWC